MEPANPAVSKLDAAVKAACPAIHGVSVGRWDDKSSWRIDFQDDATEQEKTAALSVIEAFDPRTDGVLTPVDLIQMRTGMSIDDLRKVLA